MSEITAPFLPEHAAPDNPEGTKPGYNPSPEEKKTLQLVDRLYNQAKSYRKRYDQKWIDNYKMFRGRQWKEVRPAYRHSEVINIVFQTIQSMVPVLTDSRPKLEFLPQQPEHAELADIINKIAENDWEHNNWLMTLTEIIYDAHIYCDGIGYVGFNPDANAGLGNIEFESKDIFYFFPDPMARQINDRRTKHIIEAEPTDISALKKEYPDKAAYITSDVIDLSQGDKADVSQVLFKSPVDSRLMIGGASGYDLSGKNQALKITLRIKDDEMEELDREVRKEDGTLALDEKGEPQTETIQKLKYPLGRKIIVAGGVVLEDAAAEFEDGLFPYIKLTNYVLPREFWGISEVEPIEGPQKTFNKLVSFALDVLTLMGNPIWVVGTQANIDTDNLFNKPGLIVETDDINAVRREEGVQLQPFVLQLIDRLKLFMDNISGESESARGLDPGAVTAASAIQSLQQAQQVRLRQKSRNIDAFLQDFGKLYLSRVFQFYSVPRVIRVTGNDNAAQYFTFHVERLEQPEGGIKRIANIATTGPDGLPQTKQIEITTDFDLRVSTGSSLPFAKEQKANLAMKLFQLGVIDDEELLKDVDYPNYQAVLQRLNQKKTMIAQQQQNMQMQQQGGATTQMP